MKKIILGNEPDTKALAKQCAIHSVMQQRELFVSFARFVQNYKHSYGVAYEEMFSEWLKKRNK